VLREQLKDMPYYKQALNLLASIPILLVLSLGLLGVSLLSSHKEVAIDDYLAMTRKWNEE
jgi:hypothetical protein